MTKFHRLTPALGMAALLAATVMVPTSALAGEQTRAEAAIAEASGKISAGDKVGASEQAPDLQRQARAALMAAQDMLTNHHKSEAIAEAHRASGLADQAIVTANERKSASDRARRTDMRDSEERAKQSAVVANSRANSAEAETTAANVRADNAEHSSAEANAQAEAMRNAPPVVAAPTTTTTAITERDEVVPARKPMRRAHHRIVHHHGRAAHVKTTTVETTTHP